MRLAVEYKFATATERPVATPVEVGSFAKLPLFQPDLTVHKHFDATDRNICQMRSANHMPDQRRAKVHGGHLFHRSPD